MPLEKVKISELVEIKDTQGRYGPQKKVIIKQSLEQGDRVLSGFLSAKGFDYADWQPGKVHDLEVWQKEYNGNFYWNFKAPNKAAQANEALVSALKEQHESVMEALRHITQRLIKVERWLEKIEKGSTTPPAQVTEEQFDDIPF